MSGPFLKTSYRRIFIVEDRDHWESCRESYRPEEDLVLTFDFGLHRLITESGGEGLYVDHMADSLKVEEYNHEAIRFLARWHLDGDGKDIFTYKGIDFGHAFRIEIWTEVDTCARLIINLLEVVPLRRESIVVSSENPFLIRVLSALSLACEFQPPPGSRRFNSFFFPIDRWMDERLHSSHLRPKALLRSLLSVMIDAAAFCADLMDVSSSRKPRVFLFHYHPTAPIMEALLRDRRLEVVSEKYIGPGRSVLRQRRLRMLPKTEAHDEAARDILDEFKARSRVRWDIGPVDAAAVLVEEILRRASRTIYFHLRCIDSILRQEMDGRLKLMVAFSNIGVVNAILASYCRSKGIPVYMVINGLMINTYLDDCKDAAVINSYGESMKSHYFKGMENVVCLGDPRMDAYVARKAREQIRFRSPTIVVGTAGFNNIELNSYVAYEFDFMNDVLEACRALKGGGVPLRVVLKVRPNGYIGQYQNFVEEYFRDLPVQCMDRVPIKDVLGGADLYISIYSQTIFEASRMGVPTIYYKKDTEQGLQPPFGGRSELVTAASLGDLIEKMRAFTEGSPVFDSFLDGKVMEKYVGPLDGSATRRNVEFIYSKFLSLPLPAASGGRP